MATTRATPIRWARGGRRRACSAARCSICSISGRPGDPGRGFHAGFAGLGAEGFSADGNQPQIPSIPFSYHDAAPILQALKGPGVPQGWQGALPFRYHLGPGGVRVHVVSEQDYQAADHLGRDRQG